MGPRSLRSGFSPTEALYSEIAMTLTVNVHEAKTHLSKLQAGLGL